MVAAFKFLPLKKAALLAASGIASATKAISSQVFGGGKGSIKFVFDGINKAGTLAVTGAKKALGSKRASSSQQQARAMRSQVLGAGRGIGVSGSAPARQFAPGSVRSMIARTNAGRQAFQPGTVDTRQNVVNIISDAFAQTGATTPTGAGRISPSSSKIAKVGTSYFKGKDTV